MTAEKKRHWILNTLEALLDMYSFKTGLLVGFFDRKLGEFLLPDRLAGTLDGYGEYCRIIRRSAQGDKMCKEDMLYRGRDAQRATPQVCHAGLWTHQKPIRVGGEDVGVLICGKFRLTDAESAEESRQRRIAVAKELGMSDADRATLDEAFAHVRELSPSEIDAQIVSGLEPLAQAISELYQLIQGQQRLEADKQALQDDMLNLSHELQIRLQAVMAVNENLMSTLREQQILPRDEVLSDMEEILREIEKFRVSILNLGEQTTLGQYDFRRKNIGAIIMHSVNLYESEARRKNVRFEVTPAPKDFPWIKVSWDHMVHAFHNLVNNAVKYSYYGTEAEPRFIRIAGIRSGAYYGIAIENYGIGILQDELAKIFERGYRGKLARQERRTGSGLGLGIVKQIVEAHGGWIHVVSRNQGSAWLTCFKVYLPVV